MSSSADDQEWRPRLQQKWSMRFKLCQECLCCISQYCNCSCMLGTGFAWAPPHQQAYLLFVRREGPTWHPLPAVACELPGGIFSSSRAALAVPPQPRSCQQMGLIHKLGFYQKEWSKSPLHPQRTMRITVEPSKLGDTFASPDLFALLSNHIKATPYKHVWLSASKTRELKRSHWWRDQKIMLIKSLLCVILTHHTCLPQLSFNLCLSINIHQSPQWSPCLPSLAVSTAASQV